MKVTLGGCRGGGATDFFLQTQDLEKLRRLGRWANDKTLERYLQEGTYMLSTQRLEPEVASTLSSLAALSSGVFEQRIQSPRFQLAAVSAELVQADCIWSKTMGNLVLQLALQTGVRTMRYKARVIDTRDYFHLCGRTSIYTCALNR